MTVRCPERGQVPLSLSVTALVALALTCPLIIARAHAQQPTPAPTSANQDALEVLAFYQGRIVPTNPAGVAMQSEVLLEWGVGRQALVFHGRWSREGFPNEFVTGLIGWDPVDSVIRIAGVFYHGAYFSGVVEVLDRERGIVQRQWTGHYPDGRVVPYRETWTPVSDDRFEWRIEFLRDGEWVLNLPPGLTSSPIHEVERAGR